MVDYFQVLETSLKFILDYTYTTFHVNRSGNYLDSIALNLLVYVFTWVKAFRIIPEFRILSSTFHRKSVSKS